MEEIKEKMDYYAKMAEAIDVIGTPKSLTAIDVIKAKNIFKEVNDYVQNVPMFSENEARRQEFKEFFTKEVPDIEERIIQCWADFLQKSVSAPTSFHVIGCVILQIPILYDFIIEYEKADENATTL